MRKEIQFRQCSTVFAFGLQLLAFGLLLYSIAPFFSE